MTTMTTSQAQVLQRENIAHARKDGRTFLVTFHSASRVVKLYPVEHQAVQRALQDLVQASEQLREAQGEFELRVQGEFVFLNGTRLRLDVNNYASFGFLLNVCRRWGIGALRITRPTSSRDWLTFLSSLALPAKNTAPDDALTEFVTRLTAANIDVFELEGPVEGGAGDGAFIGQAAAKQTYAQSVALTKDVINSARMGRTPSVRKIKRVVQGIVDHILEEETSLIGLSTLRDYDEYTYTHSVNVCIFSVALGRRLGMSRLQLYELGMGALLHDIGKSRLPHDLVQKSSDLTDDEWRVLITHPWRGVLSLFQLRGQQELPYRAMIVSYEHHMKHDLSGYPRSIRARTMGMTSRLVAVADAYDAATSRRSYQAIPYAPSEALKEMRDNPQRGFDPVVVKAFINLLGIYPVGTLVVLDSFELAVVRAANPNPEFISRPVVSVVSDALGNLLDPPRIVDLAIQRPDGQFARTIIKTADPERYGIRVSDYII
jgi:HD-GYP domain-containing protein (c-di-GMP phosphodiesterase class II)